MAEQKEITFVVQKEGYIKLPFTDSESCSLFGNLLDNAIEACEQIKGEERRVNLYLKYQGEMLFIDISNNIDKPPVNKNGKWQTTKKDKKIHGYGLKSVEEIVKKYDGEIAYQIEEKVFNVHLSFFDMGEI